MLQKTAVKPDVLELLKKLSTDDVLKDFALAGGTALALQLGHRESVDLDFFTVNNFDPNRLYELLKSKGYVFNNEYLEIENNTLNSGIQGIRVQFLGHIYPLVSKILEIDTIRLYDLTDIAAMKINAICNRGSKKDFWDYEELLNRFSLDTMLEFYSKKYKLKNFHHVFKSLTYFDDAEKEKDPVGFKGKSWKSIKSAIERSVKTYIDKEVKNSKKTN